MSSNAIAAVAVLLVSGFAGCAATAKAAEPVAITATDRFYPGDEIEAPALNRTVKIAPDGGVSLPLIGNHVAAASARQKPSAAAFY